MNKNNSKVIIIGAGPAGIACATQLKRYNIDSTIFEMDEIGGLVKNANLIENYPGFPNGITGIKFIQLLKKHVQLNKFSIKNEIVESVTYSKESFNIKTNNSEYSSQYLVMASGTKPIVPKFPKIPENANCNVFFNIYDLGEISQKTVAIIGAGDCAFDYAMNLGNENRVIIINRSENIKALPILQERVFAHQNIKYLNNTSIENIELVNNKLYLTYALEKGPLKVDYLLIAVGREPILDFMDIELLDNPKLFQIGDVKNGLFRQTSIAIGDGTFAAMKINSMLTKELNAGNI
jgi:thioredoxin reductase